MRVVSQIFKNRLDNTCLGVILPVAREGQSKCPSKVPFSPTLILTKLTGTFLFLKKKCIYSGEKDCRIIN